MRAELALLLRCSPPGATRLGAALLELGEIKLTAVKGDGGVEHGSADQAEHGVSEAERGPGGDEQKA